jgi:aminopeptidase N
MSLRRILLTASIGLGVTAHDVHARCAQDASSYDVRTYRLDLELLPLQHELRGTVAVEVVILDKDVEVIELDLRAGWLVEKVELLDGELTYDRSLEGRRLYADHKGDRLRCELLKTARPGQPVVLAVTYRGHPFDKRIEPQVFFWGEAADGRPYVDVACQRAGAHSWWPCKSSYRHPEDKPDRVWVHVTVPRNLTAVSCGRHVRTTLASDDRHTFHWRLDAPIPTWGVPLNVGPYVRRARELTLPGLDAKLLYELYVLPENVEKALVEFERVPEALRYFSEVFGPYPFPGEKFAIVDSRAYSSAGATVVSYGSRYPVWNAQQAGAAVAFDETLVHELAHSWWGHGVTAENWSEAWLHESFAAYAEVLFHEHLEGREAAHDRLTSLFRATHTALGLRPTKPVNCAREAYSRGLWLRGPLVLETLRHFVDDDEQFFGAPRDLQASHRHGCVTTESLAAALASRTERDWTQFFDEWYTGHGYPHLKGTVKVEGSKLCVDVENGQSGVQTFHVPLDLEWREGDTRVTRRVALEPGRNTIEVPCAQPPHDVQVVKLQRLLGRHRVEVRE